MEYYSVMKRIVPFAATWMNLFNIIFNLYAEYIIRNAGLDEAQAGIKIAGRNSNNLR